MKIKRRPSQEKRKEIKDRHNVEKSDEKEHKNSQQESIR